MKKTSKTPVAERIRRAISLVQEASRRPQSYGYLPAIIRSLERMQKSLNLEPSERSKTAGALGRLVTEDFDFSESRLGTTLLQLADDFATTSD